MLENLQACFHLNFLINLQYSEILILSGHQGIPDVEQCVYFGHLANEPTACVAMTGCPGSEDVEFTILSTHNEISHTFKWSKEGDVQILSRTVIL